MPRVISVPAPVTIFDKKTHRPMLEGDPPKPFVATLHRLAYDQWFVDHRWHSPQPNVAKFVRVIEAIDASQSRSQIMLRDEDWELLRTIIETPQNNPNGLPNLAPPLIQMQLQPLIDAVLHAERTDSPA